MTRPLLAITAVAALLVAAPAGATQELDELPGLAPVPEIGIAPMVVAPDGTLVAAYADRAADEPMTARATTGAAADPSAAAEPAEPAASATTPAAAATAGAPAESEDDPAVKREVDAESRELQELKRAEEAAHVGEVAVPAPAAVPEPGTAQEGRIPLLPEIDHDLAKLQAEFDIPIDVNEAVAQWVRFFQGPVIRPHFVKWLSRYHRYGERYRAILKDHGLPEDIVFLAMIESGFANFAYSWARASGPWQFISSTGRAFGLRQDFWVDERRDPDKAAHAAAKYLAELRQQLGDWRLAWAGYNAGAGTVLRARARGANDFWEMAQGRVLRRETKGYVPKLMAAAIVTKHREAFGFTDAEVERLSWIETDEVQLNGSVMLNVVARAANVSEHDLMELNPELRRAVTPPRPFTLKLPKGAAEKFAENWPALERTARANFAGHVVQRGDTLGAIALRFGTQVEGIMQLNGLTSARRLRIGQELLIPVPRGGVRPETVVAKAEPAKPAQAKAAAPAAAAPAPAAPPASAKLAGTPIMEPAGYRPPVAPIAGPRHVVQDGDTLWSISQRIGVDLDTLCRWNGIRNPRHFTLRIGTELLVKPLGG
jgi:membrane-bound lytic murein transglycosylase D